MPPTSELDDWFVSQVLPLEPALMGLLRRHWRRAEDWTDLRQDVYVRVYESARDQGFPEAVQNFVFTVARNLIIDRVRKMQVVEIDLVAEPELLEHAADELSPERIADARRELRHLQEALESLPPRCREVITLRKIEGLSQKEIAERLGVALGTVEKQVTLGIRQLVAYLGERAPGLLGGWYKPRREREING